MIKFLKFGLVIGGVIMSLLLFFLLTATENSNRFFTNNSNFYLLLVANAIVAFGLLVMVITLLWNLIKQFRKKEFGSRILTKLVFLFALAGIIPGSLIYLVSVQFVTRSIDSWFIVKLDPLLNSGVDLGHTALDYTLKDLENKAHSIASQIMNYSEGHIGATTAIKLARLREQMQVKEATIVNGRGRVVATASENADLVPELPSITMLKLAKEDGKYAKFSSHQESTQDNVDENKEKADSENQLFQEIPNKKVESAVQTNEFLRVVIPLKTNQFSSRFQNDDLFLQVIQPVPEVLDAQAKVFTTAVTEYRERSSSREGLRKMYLVTLTLLLLFSIFGAFTAAFFISTKVSEPLLSLAEGTKAVAEGNLSLRPIPNFSNTDELGELIQSFNIMTKQLSDARLAVETNREQLENAKTYLESVLGNMSAGVMVLDQDGRLMSCNESVVRILKRNFDEHIRKPLAEIKGLEVFAREIDNAFSEQHAQSAAGGEEKDHWQQQIELPPSYQQESVDLDAASSSLPASLQYKEEEKGITLLARGSHLPVAGGSGFLIVFDEITNIISAQRSMAWGEVARRLAHEIKNPLTPIQLSAERLQWKLASKLNDTDASFLNKSANTIVNQVSSLKRMVDDFRDYARVSNTILSRLNLPDFVDEVVHMYLSADGREMIHVQNQTNVPLIMADAERLRQVLHNLLQNAQDAISEVKNADHPEFVPRIDVMTEVVRYTSADKTEKQAVRLTILDNGPGFSSKILSRAFEPYATSKAKGTGLGLAIVKKIIEEHGGKIDIQNRTDGNGAKITILLLKLAPLSNN